MTCRNPTTHHAYPIDGVTPCCGIDGVLLLENGEVITTDAAKVTCGKRDTA